MKRVIFLFSIAFLLLSLVGCGDDGDGGGSSTTGIDFSSDEALEKLDSYMLINGTDEDFKIMIATKSDVTSSQLTINGLEVDLNSNWMDYSYYSDFAFGAYFDASMLPEGLVIEPGVELDINFILDGVTYSKVMRVPNAAVVEENTLELDKDFTVNWTLASNPQIQVVSLYGESYFWDEDDDGFDLAEEVSPATRTYKFSKNNYSAYAEAGVSWYEYGVETINYSVTGKNIIALSSEAMIEGFGFDDFSIEKKVLKTNKLMMNLMK